MVGRSASHNRLHTRKTQRPKIKLVDVNLNDTDRIVFGHVVIQRPRHQPRLTTILTFDESRMAISQPA